jgi:hypothetical protein
MKRFVSKRGEREIRETYPIDGLVEGWFFRQWEFCNGGWAVEGSDLWGRKVSKQGHDPDQLLEECARAARDIQRQLAGG